MAGRAGRGTTARPPLQPASRTAAGRVRRLETSRTRGTARRIQTIQTTLWILLMKRHPCKVLITAATPRHPAPARLVLVLPGRGRGRQLIIKLGGNVTRGRVISPQAALVSSLHWRRCEERALIRHHLSRGRCCCVAGEGQWCHQLPCGHHWVTTGSPGSWSQLSQCGGNLRIIISLVYLARVLFIAKSNIIFNSMNT